MILRFELQGGMLNLELAMQIPGRLFEERTVAVIDVSDEVSGERGFSRAHCKRGGVHSRSAEGGEILLLRRRRSRSTACKARLTESRSKPHCGK